MKKVFITGILILVLILSLSLFTACKAKEKAEQKSTLEKRVSTYHDAVYVGSNDDFTASFITGESEKLIVIDGEAGELAPFATLTVTPLSAGLFNNTYTYLLKGENGERSGDLVKDVVGAAFFAEVENAKEIGKITSLVIHAQELYESELPLSDKLEGALTWKEILAVAEKEFAENIKQESDTGNLSREIYIKLVNALSDDDAPYYYYVSFIKSPSDYWALLLNPMTGEVISKKV